MKKIMLLIFSFEGLKNITKELFKNKNHEIFVIGFVNKNISSQFKSFFTNIGFVGPKIVKDIEEAIFNVSRERAKKGITLIIKSGNKQGNRDIKTNIICDTSLNKIEKIINNNDIEFLIINCPKDKFFIDNILNISLEELKNNIDIPYNIYYEGEC